VVTPSKIAVNGIDLTVEMDEEDIPLRGIATTSLEEINQSPVFDLNVAEGEVNFQDGKTGDLPPAGPGLEATYSRDTSPETLPGPLPRPVDEIRIENLIAYLRDIGIKP